MDALLNPVQTAITRKRLPLVRGMHVLTSSVQVVRHQAQTLAELSIKLFAQRCPLAVVPPSRTRPM